MRRHAKSRRKVIWIALAAVIAVALVLLLVPKPPLVAVEEAFRGDLTLDLSTTGVVQGNVVDVSSTIPGELASVLVEEGDRVVQGQTVALLGTSELSANVDAARASLSAAQAQVSIAAETLAAERKQVNSQIAQARAGLAAARARLAELEAGARPQEIREAQAAVNQAAAQSANARRELARARELFAGGAISRRQLDEAETTADIAQANLEAAQQRLALLRAGARSEQIASARANVRSAEAVLSQALAGRDIISAREEQLRAARAQAEQASASLDAAQSRLEDARITSPVTGSVILKQAEEGETVSPQEPIITVSSVDQPLWVAAEVDQEDVAAVATGQEVQITLDAYPGRHATGAVTNVSPVAVPKDVGLVRAKVVRARINVVHSPIPLRSGMEVNIDGRLKALDDVLLVSNDAVLRVGDKDIVYVIRNRVVHRREVRTGMSNFDYTTIRSGLSAGENVAVSNLDALSDGRRVRVREEEK